MPRQDGRCAKTAAKRHLAWLEQRPGVRLLLADVARLDLGPDGRQLKKETLHERFGLPKPGGTWLIALRIFTCDDGHGLR